MVVLSQLFSHGLWQELEPLRWDCQWVGGGGRSNDNNGLVAIPSLMPAACTQ